MRLIIPCAGTQTRWGNYLGVPKYMAPVFGEPLLCRTVRQFRERIPGLSICVPLRRNLVTPPVGVNFLYPEQQLLGESNRLLSSVPEWDPTGRTTIVFGDVYFTGAAVDTIVATETDAIQWFGRSGPSETTGHSCAEIFGVTFPARHAEQLIEASRYVQSVYRCRGQEDLVRAWTCLRHLEGQPLEHDTGRIDSKKLQHFTEIDDMTDDFDYPNEYDSWLAAVERYGPDALF